MHQISDGGGASQSTSDHERFKSGVDDYCRAFRREGLPPFQISGAYDQFPHQGPAVVPVQDHWPNSWPHPGKPGVYAMFSETMALLYIGKSSRTISSRLSSCYGFETDRTCRVRGQWKALPRYVVAVAVPADSPWEAASLEEYLIFKLRPSTNRNGLPPVPTP